MTLLRVWWLCQEVSSQGQSALVFCLKKQWCVNLVRALTSLQAMHVYLMEGGEEDTQPTQEQSQQSQSQKLAWCKRMSQANRDRCEWNKIPDKEWFATALAGIKQSPLYAARVALVEELQRLPDTVCDTLKLSIMFGIAYHNAGMTTEERGVVEEGFRRGAIQVLVATSTLATGVNLPARRVIFRSLRAYNGQLLSAAEYRQMSGRAGRTGKDSAGDSIVVVDSPAELEMVRGVLTAKLRTLESCLTESKRGLSRTLLEAVVCGDCKTVDAVRQFVACSLLARQHPNKVHGWLDSAMRYLLTNQFIAAHESDGSLYPMHLGLATAASGLTPQQGVNVQAALTEALKGLNLDGSLHLCFQMVPTEIGQGQLLVADWQDYGSKLMNLTEAQAQVAAMVGLGKAQCAAILMQGKPADRTLAEKATRLYSALVLERVLDEELFASVAAAFRTSRGAVQALQASAARYAGMCTVFCEKLKWRSLALVLALFTERLNYGVQRELLPLVQLPNLKARRARVLYDAGISTLEGILRASEDFLTEALLTMHPWASNVHGDPQQRESCKALEEAERRHARRLKRDAAATLQSQLKKAQYNTQASQRSALSQW